MKKKYDFPPQVSGDSLTVTGVAALPPAAPSGYERDPENPWVFNSLWEPCDQREMKLWSKPCGAPGVTMICRCEGCPLFKRIVKDEDCYYCEYRNVQL